MLIWFALALLALPLLPVVWVAWWLVASAVVAPRPRAFVIDELSVVASWDAPPRP